MSSKITCSSNYDIKGLNVPENVELVPNFSVLENVQYHFTKHLDQSKLKDLPTSNNIVDISCFEPTPTEKDPEKEKQLSKYANWKGTYSDLMDTRNLWHAPPPRVSYYNNDFVWKPIDLNGYEVYMRVHDPNGYIKVLQFNTQ